MFDFLESSFLQTRIYGNKRIVFEDGGGVDIIEYDTDILLISSGGMRLRIFGSGFIIDRISADIVSIQGNIQSLEFENR